MPDIVLLDRLIANIVTVIALLIAFVYFLKLLEAWLLHLTLRQAIRSDSAVAGGLIDRLEASDSGNRGQRGDDRTGLLLIALGIALIGFTLVVNDARWEPYGIGAALFPILAGLVLLGRHIFLRRVAERAVADRP